MEGVKPRALDRHDSPAGWLLRIPKSGFPPVGACLQANLCLRGCPFTATIRQQAGSYTGTADLAQRLRKPSKQVLTTHSTMASSLYWPPAFMNSSTGSQAREYKV